MLKKAVIGLIRLYSFLISPLIGSNCRFYPTCSAYARQAVEKHGVAKGTVLSLRRIFRCHPWYHGCFHDEVPPAIAWHEVLGYKRRTAKKGDLL
jgi:putative membrane protein insertion efficiency factor